MREQSYDCAWARGAGLEARPHVVQGKKELKVKQ